MRPYHTGKHRKVGGWVLFLAATVCLSGSTAMCDDQEAEKTDAAAADGLPLQADPQMQILNRYVRVNSALARRVCKLSDEQERSLSALDDTWLKAECKKLVEAPKEAPAAGFARLFGFGGAPPVQPGADPQQLVERVTLEIDKKIKTCLNEDQAAAFKDELDARLKFRRKSHAAVIVGILDKRLFLTDDQRVSLTDSIAESLEKDIAWNIYLMNENYLPTISRKAIAKVLDEEQLASLSQWRNADFEAFQFEQQVMGQQEQFVIEK